MFGLVVGLIDRQRDDKEMECWVREIHLRACVRIGELVRELDTAQGERTDQTSCDQPHEVTKQQAIAGAGIILTFVDKSRHCPHGIPSSGSDPGPGGSGECVQRCLRR